MVIEMKVKGLTMDPVTNMPVVILKDSDEKVMLPIWVGMAEANAIVTELDHVATPRPMTHDLMRSLIEKLNAALVRIIINDLRETTYYALLELEYGAQTIMVDSRPSDAIALALRFQAPIYVETAVLEKSHVDMQQPSSESDETEQLRNWLESLKPEDFGKYKM